MQQLLQNIRDGRLTLTQVPDPLVQRGEVLIANAASVVSAGTEKMALDLAKKSLLGKARERPDHVRRVLETHGYTFAYPDLRACLEHELHGKASE